MKIKSLLLTAAFFGSGPWFCAGAASAQSHAPGAAKAKPAKKTASKASKPVEAEERDTAPAAIAFATDLYKKELAQAIAKARPSNVYGERPQALLRSVVVLEFSVDADGKLLKSIVRRSNHDRATEASALASLRRAAPLPKPPAILVRHGPIRLQETWLFNNDGRFQIRSMARPQIDR